MPMPPSKPLTFSHAALSLWMRGIKNRVKTNAPRRRGQEREKRELQRAKENRPPPSI
jgi:hypothetical protein